MNIRLETYLLEISKYFSDSNSSEHSYRTSFENFLKEIFPANQGYFTQQDQKAINGNKPDFIVLKNKIPVLYIEVKKVGEDLDKIEKSNQANRYFGYDNLIISDYVNFRFYRYGERYGKEVSLGNIDKNTRSIRQTESTQRIDLLVKDVFDFTSSHKEPIKSGVLLSKIMGGMARRIRDNTLDMLLSGSDRYIDLDRMKKVVQDNLIANLTDESFADMYAQTLVYGLFAARYNDKTMGSFSRVEARDLVPKTNPFLANFFDHIAGTSFPDRLKIIVDELCEVFSHADIVKLLNSFYKKDRDNKDPIIHFYEDFLKEYDEKKKMEMGVFYTPRSVVQFIVRAVDDILKTEFNIPKGLADTQKISISKKEKYQAKNSTKAELQKDGKLIDVHKEYHRVQVLDVATGTGTFLNEVVTHIYKSFQGQEGRWQSYVEEELLPRLHGFELMMASYTIAHLKLGMTLHDTGATDISSRLGVYLTNTLDKPMDWILQPTLFGVMESIAEESKIASQVKSELPIMCIIGNNPYYGLSMNKHYTDNNVYKVEPGGFEKLKERKNWLDDDYVKFIRFGESLIEKNGEGVLGMITAHGYIDNPTFRGMRWHLRKTFDKIYVIDLHGNSTKKEISPDGSKDENVFDIKTGVSILMAIKKLDISEGKKELGTIFQTDFYGSRKEKFSLLDNNGIKSLNWNVLSKETEVWRAYKEDKDEYSKGFSVAELFPKNTTGVVTARDSLVIDTDKNILLKRIREFSDENKSDDEIRKLFFGGKKSGKYKVGDSRGWKLDTARKKIKNYNHESLVQKISYRPLDNRYIYYTADMVDWGRWDLMKNFINKDNIGLILMRQAADDSDFNHVLLSDTMVDNRFMYSGKGITLEMPLYLYTSEGAKVANLNAEIMQKIEDVVGISSPEDVLDYVYAVLYSPGYRKDFKAFLKNDFPRVPYPNSKEVYRKIIFEGRKLRELHTNPEMFQGDLISDYPQQGNNEVEKIVYRDNKVYINQFQYFDKIPEFAWKFYMGGYQPAQKWLKDRKGHKLSNNDIDLYQKIIAIILETKKVMESIALIH